MKPAVDTYLAELARRLGGPRRVRNDLLAEAADGLDDAVDDYQLQGYDADNATERALADFGTVDQVASHYQSELATAQAHRTSLLAALIFPLLATVWDLAFRLGTPDHSPAPSRTASVIGIAIEVLAVLLCVGMLLIAYRLRSHPVSAGSTGVARTVGTLALIGVTLTVGLSAAMAAGDNPGSTVGAVTWQLPLAIVVSTVGVAVVVVTSIRTLTSAPAPPVGR